MNASYDFQVEGPNLLLIDGEVNIFINTIDDPYGNLAYELLTELGKTKLFKRGRTRKRTSDAMAGNKI